MGKIFRRAIAVTALILAPLTAAANQIPIEHFARLQKIKDVEISQDGRHLLAQIEQNGEYVNSVLRYDAKKLSVAYSFGQTDDVQVAWTHWANPQRILVSFRYASMRNGIPTTETRLFSTKINNFRGKALFKQDRRSPRGPDVIGGYGPVQYQDQVVSFLPNDPNNFLLQYYNKSNWPSAYKVNVDSQNHKLVQESIEGVLNWIADQDGDVRLGSGTRDEKEPYLVMRPKGEKEWIDYSAFKKVPGVTFTPLGFSSDPDQLLVASNHEKEPAGLYTFDVKSGAFSDLIYRHDFGDVTGVIYEEKTGLLRGVRYIDGEPETHWFDDRREQLIEVLQTALGGATVSIINQTPDEVYTVFRTYPEARPGSYYIYDSGERRITQLSQLYPELEEETLGEMVKTSYVARDGLEIPTYVTLPMGVKTLDAARKLPFILMPHGGPHARDFLQFDYWAQFLASRGYGVLQMNFRGSTGYGRAFFDAGKKEWGQAMQDDVTDGAAWLVNQGYADGDRLAIVGGSYGGYAALTGAIKTPELYRCAVSFAGVSDLPALLRHYNNYIAGKYSTRFIGNLWKDREMLRQNSPSLQAEAIKIPILLMHGDKDRVVPISQSNKMNGALKRNNADVRYVKFKNGDHHLSLYENRLRFLQEMESFLGTCLN
jgi:dipeptidyl aminopeptidase/acylaminoacyl peptidase